MSRILLSSQAASGHVRPFAEVARELVRRGHDVVWYTGDAFSADVARTGARFVRPHAGAFLPTDRLEETYPEVRRLSGPARASWFLDHVFVAPAAAQCRDLRKIFADMEADVLLADSTVLGAALAHELDDLLWATLSIAPLAIPDPDVPPFGPGLLPSTRPLDLARNKMIKKVAEQTVLKAPTRRMNAVRAEFGLPPVRLVFDRNATPFLYMQATSPAFEYPRRTPPPQLHFVGPLLPRPSTGAPLPGWWADLDTHVPVVLVTQGTLTTAADDLIAPTVEALAGADVVVVATTDRDPGALVGGGGPSNLRTAPFIPFDLLMPKVDVVVTNGGYGTVQLALRHGRPLVVAGQTEDKPEVCARVAWSGAGIDLRTSNPEPTAIARAVRTVMDKPAYRDAAARLAADFAHYDAPVAAAQLLERLIATRGAVVAGTAT